MAEYEEDYNMWGGIGDDFVDADSPNGDQGEDGDDEKDEDVQRECLSKFDSPDYIMEPGVFDMLKRYFKAGGSPEQVVRLLSDSYSAVAQTANLMADMLISAGVDIKEVQEMVESHLNELLLKCFDPKKADSIFTDEGETPSWLAEMIEYPTWRNLFYKLAEVYPDCLMLNFTVKLISDAGYQGEITTVSTACHQIEVFSRVLRTSISSVLEKGPDASEKVLPEFAKMVCHGQHTYLYCQLLMNVLAQEHKGGANMRRLCQEVQQAAKGKGFDVTPINLALSGAAMYPHGCQALSYMLSKNALNPADITVLYKMYTSNDPPPVDMIRSPQFLDMFIDALFKPGQKINPEHKSKYIYLLAYASCVVETWKKGSRKTITRDDHKATMQAIEKAHNLCSENKVSSELVADVGTLYQCLKFPVVAMGIVKWIDFRVSDSSYFKLNTDHTPLHLVLLDEVCTNHMLLHQRVLDLLVRLFESNFPDLDVLVQLELKKTVLDRMVHLLSRGCVLPVILYIKNCWQKGDTDISLIRHFVMEVLEVIAPPYTQEFVQIFLPLIENEDITGSLRNPGEESDPVSEFLAHCKSNFLLT